MTKLEDQRMARMRRLVLAARVHLSSGDALTPALISDVCKQLGLRPHGFRTLFPTNDSLLDAINECLVDDCVERLRAAVSGFAPTALGDSALREASVAIADALPLTRSGVIIRANRRVNALVNTDGPQRVARAERQFVGALLDVFAGLMMRLGRSFTWSPVLAVRVILDTYERSFELWVIGGKSELDFSASAYVQRTLPALLGEMSAESSVSRAERVPVTRS